MQWNYSSVVYYNGLNARNENKSANCLERLELVPKFWVAHTFPEGAIIR